MTVWLMFGKNGTHRMRAALAELADPRFAGRLIDSLTVIPGEVGFQVRLLHAQA